ncbi:hypothetical protein KKG65_01640 [Patescibacteria group bacterium]|nr:hypothetical protein [Patescibacteria group bacterium]
MSENQSIQEHKPDVNQPKEFSELSLPDQVHALCLAAQEKVGVEMITEWVTHSKGELAQDQVETIGKTYSELEEKIKWGDEGNDALIKSDLGASSKSIHGAIADSLMAKMFPDGL